MGIPAFVRRDELQRSLAENKEDQRQIEDVTRIVLRPLSSPLPLAFFAFGSGSALQSTLQLELILPEEGNLLAFAFGAFVFPPLALVAAFFPHPRDFVEYAVSLQ